MPTEIRKQGPLRALFIYLAYRHGWHHPTLLSRICGITARGIHKILNKAPPLGVEAADLCLGDHRLREPVKPFMEFLWGNKT